MELKGFCIEKKILEKLEIFIYYFIVGYFKI